MRIAFSTFLCACFGVSYAAASELDLQAMEQLGWPACLSCAKEMGACAADADCRSSLTKALGCLTKMQLEGKGADAQLACFVPVNTKRDNVFYCMVDEHDCIKPGKSNVTYPACLDKEMNGDSSFAPTHLHGDWWKVAAWTKGEVYECRPCGRVSFSDYRALPWPVQAPSDTSDYSIIASSWYEKDADNKTWTVNETSLFGPRPGHKGYPEKMNHVGVMYGLSYLENFTIVHDGSAEDEPFFMLYGCGSTKQGAYVTGFSFAKTPTASPALKAKLAQLAKANGLDGEWCVVDNSCISSEAAMSARVTVV